MSFDHNKFDRDFKRMEKTGKSFTIVVTAGVTLAFVLLVVGISANAFSGYTGASQRSAEDEARKFGQDLGLDVVGITCARRDTDGDGYISCTLSIRNGETTRVEPVECSGAFTLNEGCRLQKPTLRTNNRVR